LGKVCPDKHEFYAFSSWVETRGEKIKQKSTFWRSFSSEYRGDPELSPPARRGLAVPSLGVNEPLGDAPTTYCWDRFNPWTYAKETDPFVPVESREWSDPTRRRSHIYTLMDNWETDVLPEDSLT